MQGSRSFATLVALAWSQPRGAMKAAIVVLLLCSATSAVCQSTAPGPFDFKDLPPARTSAWGLLGKVPPSAPALTLIPRTVLPLRSLALPRPTPERRWDDAQIDPKIITHPSLSKLGTQPSGALVGAHNQTYRLAVAADRIVQPEGTTNSNPVARFVHSGNSYPVAQVQAGRGPDGRTGCFSIFCKMIRWLFIWPTAR